MRTIAAYLTGLALCLLWIITGGGIDMYAQPAADSGMTGIRESAAVQTEQVRTKGEVTFSDLKQHISLFENPAPVRVGTPERTTSVVRPHPLAGGTASAEQNFRLLPQLPLHHTGHSSPALSGSAAVDYYIYALRKILI